MADSRVNILVFRATIQKDGNLALQRLVRREAARLYSVLGTGPPLGGRKGYVAWNLEPSSS